MAPTECDRIGFEWQHFAVPRSNLEFIKSARLHRGDEQLPDPGLVPLAHRVPAAVPAVEIAHDAHALSIGRPYRERHALDPLTCGGMGAELLVRASMRPFRKQM